MTGEPPVQAGGFRVCIGRMDMTYRVYSGPPGTDVVPPLEKERWLYKEFGLLDEALGWARHVNSGGRVTLLIEGDDRTQLPKREIAAALRHPEGVEQDDQEEKKNPRPH